MFLIKPVLDAYIDANILLVLAFLVWFLARGALHMTGYKGAHGAQLKVLNTVLLAVLAAPLLAIAIKAFALWWMPGTQLNVSDGAVALYLNGGFDMKPSEFEALLGLRTRLTEDLINGASPLMLTVAAMITLGFVLCCARLVVNVARLRTLVGSAYLWRRFRSVEIRISDQVHIPFSTRGIRRRIIVLPSAMLAEPENQRISLAHEFQHLRNGDLEWELALELLRPLAFWNPVYLIWKRQVERLRELNCDHALVVRARIDPRAYSDCLLEVCRRSLRHDGARQIAMPRIGLISPLAGVRRRRSQKELFERLAALMSHVDDHSARPLRWIMAVPVVLSIAVLCLAIQRPGDWSQDRLMLSTIVNLERLEHLNATPLR